MTRILGYFPTIKGEPARFNGEQICYCNNFSFPVVLTPTRREVHRQIRKSVAFTRSIGCGSGLKDYGIQRVEAVR
jgi:hypothetical protein